MTPPPSDTPHPTDMLPTTTDDTPRTWHHAAACRGMPTALWFPARGEQIGHAKAICATCPVLDPCRQHGIDEHERFGIWGGLTERERRHTRRRERSNEQEKRTA